MMGTAQGARSRLYPPAAVFERYQASASCLCGFGPATSILRTFG
jgi:hypothetical protein